MSLRQSQSFFINRICLEFVFTVHVCGCISAYLFSQTKAFKWIKTNVFSPGVFVLRCVMFPDTENSVKTVLHLSGLCPWGRPTAASSAAGISTGRHMFQSELLLITPGLTLEGPDHSECFLRDPQRVHTRVTRALAVSRHSQC